MYYIINVEETLHVSDSEFMGIEDNLISKWIKTEELDKYHIVPGYLKDKNEVMKTLNSDSIIHIINRG